MLTRRRFLHTSLCAGVSGLVLNRFKLAAQQPAAAAPSYRLSRDVPARLFDGERCWCHPRAGIVPDGGEAGAPRVVMTMNTARLSMFTLRTDDLGRQWTEPRECETLAPRYETIAGVERPVAASDFWPRWHAATKTLLGTGHTVAYTPDWKVTQPRPRHTSYSTYDPAGDQWSFWRKLELPDAEKFHFAGAGCTQRYDLADGTILLPFYFSPPGANARAAVAQCSVRRRAAALHRPRR